jgi:hypothetical protein
MKIFLPILKPALAGFALITTVLEAVDAPLPPRVIQCRADCDAGTVMVTFNKPVQLDGDYGLGGSVVVE